VLYLDTWDPALATRFYNEEDERVDKDGALIQPPEDVFGCGAKLKSAAPSGSIAPAGSPAPSASAVAPSEPASAGPSAASPAPSAAPS
jgi:hypothetical protein